MLTEIKARFDSVPGLYLKSVEKKDADLIIKGESPNEAAVTRFGQSMEFSSGLFSNLNIETSREAAATRIVNGVAYAAQLDPNAPVPEVVAFTIKCSYARTNGQQNQNAAPAPANHVAKNN